MATEEKAKELIASINECLETPIDSLVNKEDWGTFNFNDAKSELKRLFEMLNHFKLLPIALLPEDEVNKIIQSLTAPKATIKKIKDFDMQQTNAKGTRDSLALNIKVQVDAFYVVAHLWIPYLAYQKGDVQKNIDSLSDSVKEAAGVLKDTHGVIKEKKSEIDDIIRAAKEASASVGVSHFSTKFSGEATSLDTEANKWLKVTIALSLGTLSVTLGSYWLFDIATDSTNAQIVQVLSTKLILITVFFSATLWSGKMYKALKHQVTVNKHRANSLLTFQAFTKASNDDHTRDAVLLEATKSIFSISPSGYIDNDVSNNNQSNIIEIIKNNAKPSGS